MLRIILGRARAGKSERILREIAEAGDGGRQILLVPEHASHEAEVDLCRVCGDTASRHAEVLSFRLLATRVLSAAGGLSEVTLDPGGKLLLLQKALKETAPVLKVYRRPSRKAAFLQELLDLFDEFQDYGVTPEALFSQTEEIPGAMGDKLKDLSLIFGEYEARLLSPGFDARDRMRKLNDRLEESGYIDGKDVYIDGFTYFNGQEQRAVSVFLRRARSVTVTLLGERNSLSDIFSESQKTMDLLLRMAKDVGCPSEVVNAERPDPSALGHLERCFFGPGEVWEGPADAIRLREAETAYSETEQAAADILRLVQTGKCRFRDITVAARNLPDYESDIESVFERYGIPVYLARRSDILEKPVLSLLTGSLAAVTGGYEYEDMFRYLKTGLAGLTPEECDLLENYALTWEIHGGMWLREEPWTANPDGYGAPWDEARTEALAAVNALREKVRAPLLALSDGLKAGDNGMSKVEALYGFVERLGLQGALEEKIARLQEAGELQAAEETAQLWTILCGVLDQFAGTLGDEPMDTEEFARLLRLVLTRYSVGTIPASLDQVTVSEISRNDRHAVKYLFLLGANDSVLPAVPQNGGILNGDDREELAGRGVKLAPAGADRMGIELQNLYAALAQPTEGLCVSYPVTDVSGAELRPSFVIGRIRMLFPAISLEREDPDKSYRLAAVQPALEAAGEDPGGPLWRYFSDRPACGERLAVMERASRLGRGSLSRPAVKSLYGETFRLSASRAEKLKSCHFAYFMEYGLKAKPRVQAAFDAPQIGTFLHYILENVTRETQGKGGFTRVTREELREMVRRWMDEYARRELPNFSDRSARFRYLFSRLRTTACAVVEEVAEELKHSDFVPLEFELSFGDHGTLPAVAISEPDGELRVNGKVDRVDGWVKDGRLYLRVVDYKTGRKSFDLAEVRMGLDIQLLLYLFTLQKEGSGRFGREIEPAGVLYLPARDDILSLERGVLPEKLRAEREKNLRRSGLVLNDPEVLRAMEHDALTEPRFLPVRVSRDGDLSGSVASAAQLGKLAAFVEKLLHQITREVRDGNIDADPCCHSEDDSFCAYCDFAPACHFEDGRGGDHLHYITPVKPQAFWQQLETEGGGGRG